jgi:ATP-binding cassette subfamily B protein
VKLRQLLASHLGPYRNLLLMVLVLQAIQTSATLALPTVNADLIDNGVLAGDSGYIRSAGAVMLAFTLGQIFFAVAAVW